MRFRWGRLDRALGYADVMDRRLEQRALTPRYTVTEAAALIKRPPDTIRRWSLGHARSYKGRPRTDEPLIHADGDRRAGGVALSFLNLLELRMLSGYRHGAALQAIRRALVYAGNELGEERPLITREFHVAGGELLTRFAETDDGALFLNASRGGQITTEQLIEGISWTNEIDYDDEVARRWWFRTRKVPVLVDTLVSTGRPITAETGVRLDAITTRAREGYGKLDIAHDTGATKSEVVAALAA
jgi:hypothetical protein